MKKILALVLALIMVMGLATTASAAGTATISVAATDSHSYEVYQILTGTLEDGKLVDVALGTNGKLPENTTLAQALAELEANKDAADTAALAVILKYVDLESTPKGTVSNSAPMTVDTGYYLLKDLGPLSENESLSLYVVEVVDSVTVNPKRGTIIPEKKVDDINDSDLADLEANKDNEDSADYDIGDEVPFTLKATLPANYADFKVYKLVFHDEASEGLTFNADSVKVYLNTIADANLIAADKYTLVTDPADDCTFEVNFADLKVSVPSAAAGSNIIVKFTATLNDQAALGAVGNSNEMYLEFSNDPNWVPDPDAETPPPPPTGKTPEDKVVVFTYQVVVNKVDEEKNPLVGATFTLFKWDDTTDTWVSLGAIEGTNQSTFQWPGVDDGKYKLEETKAPTGYNKLAPIEFEITASHDEEAADPKLTVLNGGNMFQGDVATGNLTAQIENLPGAVLPETGGVGTTLFYIIGGLLVAAAVVLLVTKKRMASAE